MLWIELLANLGGGFASHIREGPRRTSMLAGFCGGLALAKPVASSVGELTFPKLLANFGGAFALD